MVYFGSSENQDILLFEDAICQAAIRHAKKVEFLQVNNPATDEWREKFELVEMPALILFYRGQEKARLAGAQPADCIEGLFEMAEEYATQPMLQLSLFDRLIRVMIGCVIIMFGIIEGEAWIIIGLGFVLICMAFVDRFADLYRWVRGRMKKSTGWE